ncbi:ras-related protein rab-32 [Anaeramoeba flamelloides]|uniref:Ras-related protein Rab n=1 Tax=Anaeramoeba flamelloides TaxID=1746091 RepID=A0AAV7Z1W8_9EUKA|nr:ras-related protein rab-32 [Anaeramoeba flamelloides]
MTEFDDNETKEYLHKIVVVGEKATGKTSVIQKYVNGLFSRSYKVTIGVDFALKLMPIDEKTNVRIQFWDIAGQERYGNMTRVFYKEAMGALLVFDVTRLNTFDAVKFWKKDIDQKVFTDKKKPIPTVLLANKIDLIEQDDENWISFREKMDKYCKEKGFIKWFETSAKEDVNLHSATEFLVKYILKNNIKPYKDEEDEQSIQLKEETEEMERNESNSNSGGCC